MGSSSSITSPSILNPFPPQFSRIHPPSSLPTPSSPPCHRRFVRRGLSLPLAASSTDFNFALHDALESSGIDTSHAREARKGFVSQIEGLSDIERETSISINRGVDLGKTALYIAAEDDSLISHSSVPLPVDAFLERLDDLSMGYCSHYNSSCRSSREKFLESIEKYLYVRKGFRRSMAENRAEPRALYLHSVLTHRSGSALMLSIIHSEILKMFRMWGLLDFDVEIFFPRDHDGLPRAYDKQKSKESDQPHIMTVQMLLEEVMLILLLLRFLTFLYIKSYLSEVEEKLVLSNLKAVFWPFQHDPAGSLFLRAADAANCVDSAYQLASAKAARHRLERGVWTSVRFGDMRRALSACERLILLKNDPKEMRDYSILLYHCGLYDQSLKYLKLYQDEKSSSAQRLSTDSISILEEAAVEKLLARLNLIAMEEGWSQPFYVRNFLGNNSEPW
ncbi:hypothetical protein V6N12_032138 [Hibiscus sabdariffa]|uniref:Protein SirB1 N-terminal domain-containing protein n=1 Tax=Hibiscus sabdariffa TaxID=183260 RepID=A0ABR2CDR2_9ROSI